MSGATGQAVTWPAGLSHAADRSIGELLAELKTQFPALTLSKLRYLEDQGLLQPARTASGFRRYSLADLERARFVLTQQRDNFLPLKVIRARLSAMDQNGQVGAAALSPRLVRSAQVDPEDVATLTGQDQALVQAVAKAAGVEVGGRADAALIRAVEAVAELAHQGLELRHLRAVFQAAARQADLVESVVASMRTAGSAGRERARAVASETAHLVSRLNEAAVRLALADREL